MRYYQVLSLIHPSKGNAMSLVTMQPGRLAALACTPAIRDTTVIGGIWAPIACSDGIVSRSGAAQPIAVTDAGDSK
jgi:hypothetical protein